MHFLDLYVSSSSVIELVKEEHSPDLGAIREQVWGLEALVEDLAYQVSEALRLSVEAENDHL